MSVSAMAVEAVSGNGGEAVAPAPAPAPVKEVSAKVEAKEAAAVTKNASFREESNFLDDLKETRSKPPSWRASCSMTASRR